MRGPRAISFAKPKRPTSVAVRPAALVPQSPPQPITKPCESRWRYHLHLAILVVVVIFCLARAVWLILLTLVPNTVMNRMMSTSAYDDGTFWRVVNPNAAVAGLGVAGLATVALAYATIPLVFLPLMFTSKRVQSIRAAACGSRRFKSVMSAHRSASNPIKLTDLAVQIVFLVQQMEAGMPVVLISLFALTVVVNATTTAVLVWSPRPNMGLRHVVIDTALDFLVAVVYPGFVVVYCITHFTFDRDLFAINMKVFVATAFERVAAIQADPVQVEIIRHSLDSLRIASVLDIFTRVGVNAVLCFRLHLLARYVATSRVHLQSRPNVYERNRIASVVFVLFAIAVGLFTCISIHTSAVACRPHPECAQAAHRWISSSAPCPCIAFVDRNLVVRTYDEWTHGLDITDKVAALAMSGDLQTLQIVNRALPAFPESLRRCTKLKHLSLLYTATRTLPIWVRELTALEYVHIEGTLDNTSFRQLPLDTFANMHALTYLHLGQHLVQRLPSFDGLARVKILTLAMLSELEEIPSFDRLTQLERLTLVSSPRVQTIPDLAAVPRLQFLAVNDCGAFCCNGFLEGFCDLNQPNCREYPRWGAPATTSLAPDRRASPATLAYVRRFYNTTCTNSVTPPSVPNIPTSDGVQQCNGSMFRQCALPGLSTPGVCYNKRWMVISCEVHPTVVAMRCEQIARRRGLPCDPTHEAWLGCGQT